MKNNMNKTALIIANGSHPSKKLIQELLRKANVCICADGGANHAKRIGIKPDIILGDFDSITQETKNHFSKVPQQVIADQNSTDLEKAIIYCINNGYVHSYVVGAFGDRIDHSTGSLGCFKKFRSKIELSFVDNRATLTEIQGKVSFEAEEGERLSLLPLERCTGVTTVNLLYPLKNEVLEIGVREGISNRVTGSPVTISAKTGTLLLYKFHPEGRKKKR